MEKNEYIAELKKCVEDFSRITEELEKASGLKKHLSQAELRKCAEDCSRINEVLGKTSELKKYLSQMGIRKEFTESAATVEIIRKRLKSILLTEGCQILASGITHKDGRFGVDDDGSIMISDGEYFGISSYEPGKILYRRNSHFITHGIDIDRFGAIESLWDEASSPYAGNFHSITRNHEKNTIIIESSDGATYHERREKPDNGNPVSLDIRRCFNFKKEYTRLVRDFPKIKGWYDAKYPGLDGDEKKFMQISKSISDSLSPDSLQNLSMHIDFYISSINKEKDKQKDATKKYEAIVSTIAEIGDRSEVGKIVANSLMKKITQNPLRNVTTETEEPKDDSEEQKTEDKDDFEKQLETIRKLRIKLEQLKNRLKEEESNTSRIYSAIDQLEQEIKKIPIIGRKIIKRYQKTTLDDEIK